MIFAGAGLLVGRLAGWLAASLASPASLGPEVACWLWLGGSWELLGWFKLGGGLDLYEGGSWSGLGLI